jgi:hypothetical protein
MYFILIIAELTDPELLFLSFVLFNMTVLIEDTSAILAVKGISCCYLSDIL